MINFYHYIWKKRSHILATLTNLAAVTGKKKGSSKKRQPRVWKPEHQQAFDKVEKMLIDKVKLLFPNSMKPFHL